MRSLPPHKSEYYLVDAKLAAEEASKTSDPTLKASLEHIAQLYREMAERARKLDDDHTLQR